MTAPEPPGELSERELDIWLDGFRSAADMMQGAADDISEQLRGGEDPDDGTCDDCGAELIHGLGGQETCPRCDL